MNLQDIGNRLKELAGELLWTETTEETPEVQKTSIAVYKQADGAYRWFGIVSNHYRDRDTPPEIISSKAHSDYVDWADKEGKYPELWLWHVPGSRVGQADWLDFADGFLMSSGTFDKGKEAVAERLAASSEPLTMSHGFMRLKAMTPEAITDGYRMFEASITPQGAEANPWTQFGAIKEASMPISEAKKAFLGKYLDADTIGKLEADTGALKAAAEAAGVDWKEAEAVDVMVEPVAAAPTIDMAAITESVASKLADRIDFTKLSTIIADIKATTDGLPAIVARMDALEATVKGVKKSDDEKIAKALTPKAAEVFAWTNYRPSQATETVLKEGDPVDETLKAAQPTAFADFVSQAMRGGN